MKGLILSGGKGTRLRPITHTSAKQLVPVANQPVLFYGLEAMRQAEITDVGIIVGHTHEEIHAAVGDGSNWDLRVEYIHQEAPLGLAHAVLCAEEYLGDEPFVMYLGDNLILGGIMDFVDRFRLERPNALILLAHVAHPEQFGVAELDGAGRVVRLVEKPKQPKSDLALVGVYLFSKSIFEACKQIKPSARNELEITDAIQYLIDHDSFVEAHVIEGWWKDTGRLEDMLEANRMILDTLQPRVLGEVDADSEILGKVVIEKGARVIRSTLRGPLIIGQDTEIVDSYVGPFTSIDSGCRIECSEIEHSIMLSDSSILHVGSRIEDSLIGKNACITKCNGRPSAYRVMVGDHSRVEIL